MLIHGGLLSCNSSLPSFALRNSNLRISHHIPYPNSLKSRPSNFPISPNIIFNRKPSNLASTQMGLLKKCQSSGDPFGEREGSLETERRSGSGNGGQGRDWTTSILLFFLWSALMFYVFFLAPNQTPSMDIYLLKKLLNLIGEDGFKMNQVLVSLWYIMGLWPLVYGMLLIPSGRSSKSNIPLWPFLVLSFFGGVYALLPYFVFWKPPPPLVEEAELKRWPLNFLESKFTAGITFAAGLGILAYAGLAGDEAWKEFYQYFRESRFIHAMSIDFLLLSSFAPFWVYNDMTVRKWFDKGTWLLPLALIPFLGPAFYAVLRPSLTTTSTTVSLGSAASEPK